MSRHPVEFSQTKISVVSFCTTLTKKTWFLEGLQKLWLMWWRTSWIKALRDVQTTHLCDRKHPWCSRHKEHLWCNVTSPNTEPECIYAALGLSQARDPQRLFCLPCRLQHYRLLGSSPGYQSKPGDTFSSPLYSSPVPIGDGALSQPRHTASDIIHYMKVDNTQIWLDLHIKWLIH